MRNHLGSVDMAFLGMECDGAPLTWLYHALLTRPVPKRMSDSRKLSGSNAMQAAAIVQEFGATAYIYVMGEEAWLAWCSNNGVKARSRPVTAEHLFGQREWLW